MFSNPMRAEAIVMGSEQYPNLHGKVEFFPTVEGVRIRANIAGLPFTPDSCEGRFFGFHIHSGRRCTGTQVNPFADAGGHFNPNGCDHPHHAGDLPPLLGCGGRASSEFLTDRFTVDEVIGKTVIIHLNPDDFTTQPSGNSGEMIACGEILGIY